jgi:hypothetical protein
MAMATQLDPRELDVQEQFARLRLMIEESEKFSAETRRIVADMLKANAEVNKIDADLRYQPWFILFQGLLATSALVGAGIAIGKLFLS